jgi:hypothetical protein
MINTRAAQAAPGTRIMAKVNAPEGVAFNRKGLSKTELFV